MFVEIDVVRAVLAEQAAGPPPRGEKSAGDLALAGQRSAAKGRAVVVEKVKDRRSAWACCPAQVLDGDYQPGAARRWGACEVAGPALGIWFSRIVLSSR
ncbi:hypothetical protein [Saccharopolyspora rosea]|uniref:hypothetical protein n=1 Tax=Saccharopolyspora rosea TaxID=524884 RepID=UPI0021D9CB5C|nr:hypothetical protein [Saccharopolyspora rosea]